MTVVFATHDGVALRAFARNGDGVLNQVAQLAVGSSIAVDPNRLVTLVADLADELGWLDDMMRVEPAEPARALPPAKNGHSPRTGPRRTSAEMAALGDEAVEFLSDIDEAHAVKTVEVMNVLRDMHPLDDRPLHDTAVTKLLHRLAAEGRIQRLDEQTFRPNPTYRWYGKGVTQSATTFRFSTATMRPKVLDLLKAGPSTSPAMREAFGIPMSAQATFDRMLRRMASTGEVVRIKSGARRSEAAAWRLP